ncbi:hypothetical protein COU18_03645 [Candidatus Kaiserbacteria bacterium CG10_big_fil_rev_8_21_14_0_10_51_14]|uniref:N-acetyltransferase domain-containing protein n=1 Tax=Candidatus Kaiserbacteria bacterium CG10_big_fil_rev_8_21_14_0_10_51_14 TaxID=1974610 RepID=A0A2H0UBF1_9BACT|nr:MAG: hypothetical protein COU18_03645 [Candidatus Kaiserbacteria bacterium CG10_big_fil_rev_8_21_14_0_10_51_14]
MNIEIRDAIPSDAEASLFVRYKAWLAIYPNAEHNITVEDIEERFKAQFSEEKLVELAEQIDTMKKNGRYVVAVVDEKIVGICLLLREEDKSQLRSIYVLPEYQGKGIGKALWNEVRKSIDPDKDTFVDVAIYNTNAIGFYSNLGFKDTGRRFSNPRLTMKNGSVIPEMEMRLDKTKSKEASSS